MEFNSLFNFVLFFSISAAFPFYYREILSYINIPFLHSLFIIVISFFLSLILNGSFGGFKYLFSFISGSYSIQTKSNSHLNLPKVPSSPNLSNHYILILFVIILSISYSFSLSLTFLCYSISELDFTVICSLCFTQFFSVIFNYIFFQRKPLILGFLAMLSIFSGLFTVLYNFSFLHRSFCYTCHASKANIPFQNHFGEKTVQILCQMLASFFKSLSDFMFAKTIMYINEEYFFPNDYSTMHYKSSSKSKITLNLLVHLIQFWVFLISSIILVIMFFGLEYPTGNKFEFNIDYITLLLFGVALNELRTLSEIKLIESPGWHFSVPFSKHSILPVLFINLIILNQRFNKAPRLPIDNTQLSFQYPLNIKKTYTIEQSVGLFFIIVGTVFLSLTTDNNYSFISINLNSGNHRSSYSSTDNESDAPKVPESPPGGKVISESGMQINLNSQENEFSSLLRIEDAKDNDIEKK